MILVTWEDDPSCSAVYDTLVYELVVLIADKQEHYVRVDMYYSSAANYHSNNPSF